LEIRRWPCVSPTETKILRSKVELAFRLSFPVIPSEGWENRDIYGKTELSEQAVSESNLSTPVSFAGRHRVLSSSFALSVSHRIVFSPFMKPFTVAPSVASRVPPQSAAEIFRPKVYYRVLVVFLWFLTIVALTTVNLPDIATVSCSSARTSF